MSLKTGWVGENEGLNLWPKLYFVDISRFYSDTLARDSLWQRLETEYKEGKAYRYFSSGFIGEVFINLVSSTSGYCCFKTKCLPSQRVNAKQYDVWANCKKRLIKDNGVLLHMYCWSFR